jgi:hypothetical protein
MRNLHIPEGGQGRQGRNSGEEAKLMIQVT